MKTSTLTSPLLNRAVAMALGHKVYKIEQLYASPTKWVLSSTDCKPSWMETRAIPDYSTDISQAWPIMKERKIELTHNGVAWLARGTQPPTGWHPDLDPQVAAMRAFVASVYGDDIELEP